MKKETLNLNDMEIFVYSFELMDSRMYMIRGQEEILVVDPCEEDALLQDAKGIQKAVVLLTHEHYDHISGVNWLRKHFICRVYAGSICAERVQSIKDNLSSRFAFLFILNKEKYDYVRQNLSLPYTCMVDKSIANKESFKWQSHTIEFYETGGHSPGSCLIMMDESLLFAGDNVIGNGEELRGLYTDKQAYSQKVLPILQRLDGQTFVLPGHGESNTLHYFMDKLPQCL